MNKAIDKAEIRKALEAAALADASASSTGLPSLRLDIAKYETLLKDIDISEDGKKQMIEALWAIVVAFVEIGYGTHPVQQACGKVNENKDKATIDGPADLYCNKLSMIEVITPESTME